jgi:hypothetical protein
MAASDFFDRWSKRPANAKGAAADAPEDVAPPRAKGLDSLESASGEQAPAPTLERAQQLTPADDFRPFVQADVDPAVRNAALRQLFTDPHFNVMDGLDIYIDDYNTPNPLPVSDISRMAGASILRLIQSDPSSAQIQQPTAHGASADAATSTPPPSTEIARDDPDLRLQQNPDSGPKDAEPGPT